MCRSKKPGRRCGLTVCTSIIKSRKELVISLERIKESLK
jgi:hypothetical protein